MAMAGGTRQLEITALDNNKRFLCSYTIYCIKWDFVGLTEESHASSVKLIILTLNNAISIPTKHTILALLQQQ